MSRGVLVVEDETDLRDVLVELMQGSGLDVFYAADGMQALSIWEQLKNDHYVDCIVCDLNMPRLNGAEFIRRLIAAGSDAPVVVLSGYASASNKSQMRELGIFHFLEKPFDGQLLMETVFGASDLGAQIREVRGAIQKAPPEQMSKLEQQLGDLLATAHRFW